MKTTITVTVYDTDDTTDAASQIVDVLAHELYYGVLAGTIGEDSNYQVEVTE